MSEPDIDADDGRDPYGDVVGAYHRMADALSTVADQLADHRDVTGVLREMIETTGALDRRLIEVHRA
jgi:hypothetical protein